MDELGTAEARMWGERNQGHSPHSRLSGHRRRDPGARRDRRLTVDAAAGLSAVEKTYTSRRQRVIDVAELAAFARAFGLPIAWFFLPPERREASPVPRLYEHAATMAVDVFGDEDARQWYLARVVDLLGAPGSILHDELLGSAGYPSADEWARIDLKREELLRAALGQFSSENSDLVQALLDGLEKVRQVDDRRLRRHPRPHTRRSVRLPQQSRLGPASAGCRRHRRRRAAPSVQPLPTEEATGLILILISRLIADGILSSRDRPTSDYGRRVRLPAVDNWTTAKWRRSNVNTVRSPRRSASAMTEASVPPRPRSAYCSTSSAARCRSSLVGDSPTRVVVPVVAVRGGNERARVHDQCEPNPSRSRKSSASRPEIESDANDPTNSNGSTSLASVRSRWARADGSMPSRAARSVRRCAAASSSSTSNRVMAPSLRRRRFQ